MNKEKALGFLGLLNRGGALLIGDALRLGIKKASLIVLAEDAKDATKRFYEEKASFRAIPILWMESKEELGHAIGYDEVAAIGVKDQKAARKLAALLKEGEEK